MKVTERSVTYLLRGGVSFILGGGRAVPAVVNPTWWWWPRAHVQPRASRLVQRQLHRHGHSHSHWYWQRHAQRRDLDQTEERTRSDEQHTHTHKTKIMHLHSQSFHILSSNSRPPTKHKIQGVCQNPTRPKHLCEPTCTNKHKVLESCRGVMAITEAVQPQQTPGTNMDTDIQKIIKHTTNV